VTADASVRTLADLRPGQRCRVDAVEGAAGLSQRLREMGLTEGTVLEVIRFAPLGDPMEIRLRGYLLSLRRADARVVRVREEDGA
jgi:Fe2+ transport system protein FeoA